MQNALSTPHGILRVGQKIYHVGLKNGDPYPHIEVFVIEKFVTSAKGRQTVDYVVFSTKPKLKRIWPSRGFIGSSRWDRPPRGVPVGRSILVRQISFNKDERCYFFKSFNSAINRIDHIATMLEKKAEAAYSKLADIKNRIQILRSENANCYTNERGVSNRNLYK